MPKPSVDHTYDIKCSATIGAGNATGTSSIDLLATATEMDTGIALFSFKLSYPGVISADAGSVKDLWDKTVARMMKEGYQPTITGDGVTSQQTSWHGVSRSAVILCERLSVKAMDKLVDMGETLAKTKHGYKHHPVTDL